MEQYQVGGLVESETNVVVRLNKQGDFYLTSFFSVLHFAHMRTTSLRRPNLETTPDMLMRNEGNTLYIGLQYLHTWETLPVYSTLAYRTY